MCCTQCFFVSLGAIGFSKGAHRNSTETRSDFLKARLEPGYFNVTSGVADLAACKQLCVAYLSCAAVLDL